MGLELLQESRPTCEESSSVTEKRGILSNGFCELPCRMSNGFIVQDQKVVVYRGEKRAVPVIWGKGKGNTPPAADKVPKPDKWLSVLPKCHSEK